LDAGEGEGPAARDRQQAKIDSEMELDMVITGRI
jgi:hypothetical protein